MTTPARPETPDERRAARIARLGPQAFEPLPGFTAAAVWEGWTPAPELVKRMLAPEALTVLFGQSGHFKSALAVDMSCCVGLGVDFLGLRTRKAGVLYVAGEGHRGIRKRLRAWMMKRNLNSGSEQPAVFITASAADLVARPEQLSATVEQAATVLGLPIGLIIVDTLAANFGPGDENLARDMALAIAGAREAAPQAAVLIVHHTGHGQIDRERGSYALIAAADYRLQATYDEPSKLIELKWLKCKDDERPEPLALAWQRVPLEWTDADGEELTSIVLERLEGTSVPQGPRSTGLGRNQETALKSLRSLYARARRNLSDQGRDPEEARILLAGWRADLERRKVPRQRYHEVERDLQARGLIVLDGPHVTLVEGIE